MESGSVGASNEGVLVPLSISSDAFLSNVLAPLKSSFLYEESKQSFRYTSAVLIKNAGQEKKYNAFCAKKRELGYTEKDLSETYGYLLFSDITKAEKLGETGLLIGNSTCKTLGDPTKGVYISQYSDCLDQNPWSHGQSGYIAIFKLRKGRVKEVSEKFTQNLTAPSRGFDCHISKEFSAVVPSTSSFLAFQRTQCYLYEFCGDGSDETVQCPSAAFLYAIVSFSFIDPKLAPVTPQCRSEQRELAGHYFPWKGQLHIASHYYNVVLRATTGALIPAELPAVVKVNQVISVSDLRRVLPKAIFQNCFSGEVCLGGLYCSRCELVSSEVEQTNTLSLLLQNIKAKDVALTVPLNDSGFLILLPSSSYFCSDDSGSSSEEFLQGIFVFPDSRLIRRGVPPKAAHQSPAVFPGILQVPPGLNYSEGTSPISLGMAASSPKEIGVISDRCQVPDANSCVSSFPEWTSAAWENFSSYLQKPDSFQLPVSRISDVLTPVQEKEKEVSVDSVNLCMLSPEEVPASHVDLGSVGNLTSQDSAVNTASVDGSAKGHADFKTSPQSVKLGDLLSEAGNMETENSPSSGDLRAELIVSITSAEPTVSGSDESKTKGNSFQLPDFHTEVNVGKEVDTAKKVLKGPEKVDRGTSKEMKHSTNACHERDEIQNEEQMVTSQNKHKEDEASQNSRLHVDINSSRTHKFGKFMKHKKLKSAAVGVTVAKEKKSDPENVQMEQEAYSLRRKIEHWDLKPVISKCGRILVPHGSANIYQQIKDLRTATESANQMNCDKIAAVSANVHDITDRITEQDNKLQKVAGTSLEGEENQHLKVSSHVSPERSNQPGIEISPVSPPSSGNERADLLPGPERLSPEKPTKRMETLINRLKSALRGKRKNDPWEEISDDPENELCLKRSKFEAHPGFLKSGDTSLEVPGASSGLGGVSTVLSVDPCFAFALGLTPKPISNKMVKSDAAGAQQRKDPSETKKATMSDRQPHIVQSPRPIFPNRRRLKMLRKHQGTHTENVKEKWWLHFQRPTCPKGEDKKGNPGREAAGQRTSCSPTDGLNLLADLALCATSNQVPSQPEQGHQGSLKNSNSNNAEGAAEQESVLHALLRKPPTRPSQSLRSPAPVHYIGDSELASLITTEHAYSMHPSTSLLLGFSSMPFQVYPLSGCTKLLYHHQAQHLPVDQEDKSCPQTPECTENHPLDRRRFRRSRTFVIKDGSVQVTKRWKRNYDFGLDSKFSNDPQFRTICRALHGQWNFSVKDTSDEVRLIFHMWIALFYSRSVPRFIEFDSDPSSLEKTPAGSVSTPPHPDLGVRSFAPDSNLKDTSDDTMSRPLDLSTNGTPTWDQKSVILDLSKNNSPADISTSVSQVATKEACETPKTPLEFHARTPFQCYRNLNSPEMITKVNDIRSTPSSKTLSILQERTSFHPGTVALRSNSPLRGRNIENQNTSLMDNRDVNVAGGVHTESGGKNPSQEGSRETVPTRIQVILRELLGKEKQACEMEPEVFSQVKHANASKGIDCCLSEEPVSKELYPKGEISTSYPRPKLNDQQSPTMSCRSDGAEKVSVAEKNLQTPPDICFTGVPDQKSFQHNDPDTRNEPGNKENAGQQRAYVVDEPQRAALIMSVESVGLLDRPFLQTNSDETQDQSSAVVDPSCSLKSDQPSQGSDMIDSQVPFPGECSHKEDAAPPHEPCSGVVSDEAKGQKVESFIDETATSEPTDVQKPSSVQRGEPEMSNDRTSPSLCDDRCPTPTLDEEPYQFTPCSGPRSSTASSTSTVAGETLKPMSQKYPSQISTLSKGKMPLNKKYKALVKSNLKSHSAPRVIKRKDKSLSVQSQTDKCSQTEIANDKGGLQRGKPQATGFSEKSTLPLPSACHSKECLPTFKPNTSQDIHQDASQPGDELPSCSQSQVIPAKISKSDETQEQDPSENFELQKSKTSTDLNTSELLEKRMKNLNKEDKRGQSKDSQLCPEGLSNLNKTNSETTNHPPANVLNRVRREDTLKLKRVVQIFGKEAGGFSDMGQKRLTASPSGADHRDETTEGDSSCWGLQGSIRCTIFNSSRKRSSTFLEQMSKRCLQEDLTEASVEEDCLIFSEQMKQVLKRSNAHSVPIREPAAHESILMFSSCSAAEHSSNLQGQKGARLRPDSPSFVGLKITVNTSNRTSQANTSEEETGHSDGLSGVTAGHGRLYTGKMDNVGAVRKGPVRHTDIRRDSGDQKTDHVKREQFHKITHLEMKRYHKTKYRFYILMTSDDPFFEETKVRLEAEGHTTVQPSEFFPIEESSPLLIILRNEDIAEHICEVPYLLSLKKFRGVQFAGIDEPDDFINLTHQELFVRGGFLMFDRAALESLKLRDMKMLSDILQELSRSGRWKWILHYRHSRWLKEKSRLSAEVKEKKNFITWCQEAGILEVLPYHECDHLSRDQPDYLSCLVRLQVQNVSARYPVFITERTTNSSFGTHGILALTLSSFLTCKTFLA